MPSTSVRPEGCQPGDIFVTVMPHGFLIGRVLDPRSDGQWWQFIVSIRCRADALQLAFNLAGATAHRAWIHQQDDQFRLIRPDDVLRLRAH
jgi:hypothetical protein